MLQRRFIVSCLILLVSGVVMMVRAQSAPVPSLPAGPMRQKATTACTECHDAEIVLQQRLSKAAWTKEVDKMMKWGALVEEKDRDPLIDYLSTNFGVDQPPYQPPHSAVQQPRK